MSVLEVLSHPPPLDRYTSLQDHQSATPASFFNAPPVLYFRCDNCEIQIPSDLLAEDGPLQSVFGPPPECVVNGVKRVPAQVTIDKVQVVVGTDALLLFPTTGTTPAKTLSIPYPLITLHAIQHMPSLSSPNSKRFNLYLQISPPSTSESDEPLEIFVIPQLTFPSSQVALAHQQNDSTMVVDEMTGGKLATSGYNQETLTKALFSALTKCADLYPTHGSAAMGFFESDDSEGDSDSDLDDPIAFEGVIGYGDAMDLDTEIRIPKPKGKRQGSGFPGEGGWITSENVHLLASNATTPLGPGAGTVRRREESEESGGGDGSDGEIIDNPKWRRTG